MSNANNVDTTSLYGASTITSGDLTAEEQAILAGSTVEVRDGDDLITATGGEETEEITLETPGDDGSPETETETPEDTPAELLPLEAQTTDELVMQGLEQRQEAFAEAAAKVAAAGVDPAVILEEYRGEGKLSDKSYADLEAAGYDKASVDALIADQEAQTQVYYKAVYAHAGGPEGFNRLAAFAKVNDPSAAAKFNEALESGNLAACKEIISGLKGKLASKYGTNNKGITAAKAQVAAKPANAAKPFESSSEMVKAMGDPRYNRDAKYTREVEARVAAS